MKTFPFPILPTKEEPMSKPLVAVDIRLGFSYTISRHTYIYNVNDI